MFTTYGSILVSCGGNGIVLAIGIIGIEMSYRGKVNFFIPSYAIEATKRRELAALLGVTPI